VKSAFDYRIIRSDRRSLGLEIGDGLEVLVRAPRRMQEAQIEAFVERHRDWILQKLEKRRAFLEKHPVATEEQLAAWMQKARSVVPDRVAHYAQRMGVAHAGIHFTKNRVRVGSCCQNNRIFFSCRLMGYPSEVLDYVIVHELAHILHKNHGPAFWKTVEAILPDYKKRRIMLRG